MDNSILVWLGICRAKRKGYDHCYQTICHQNEPLWTVLAAYSSSSQTRTGFFLYFFFSIWSNEHDACLIIRGMNGCMYLAREKSYLCFFLDESGFCWFAHPVIEIEHQWPTDQATTTIRGCSQTTLTRFWIFLTTYPPALIFSMVWTLTKSKF